MSVNFILSICSLENDILLFYEKYTEMQFHE